MEKEVTRRIEAEKQCAHLAQRLETEAKIQSTPRNDPEVEHLRYLLEEKSSEIQNLRRENEHLKTKTFGNEQCRGATPEPKSKPEEVVQETESLVCFLKEQHKKLETEAIDLRLRLSKEVHERNRCERELLMYSTTETSLKDIIGRLEYDLQVKHTEIDFLKRQENMLREDLKNSRKLEEQFRMESLHNRELNLEKTNMDLSVELERTKRQLEDALIRLELQSQQMEPSLKNIKTMARDKVVRCIENIQRQYQLNQTLFSRAFIFYVLRINAESRKELRLIRNRPKSKFNRGVGEGDPQARDH